MKKETKEVLNNRFKSLLWRLAMVALAALVSFILDNLNLLNLSPSLTTVVGLVLGEVSKYLNVDRKKLNEVIAQ